jgi:hypothetical protein
MNIQDQVREASMWDHKPVLTDEEIEQSATTTCADHTEGPTGYVQASNWADKMLKTHKQLLCGECTLWKIWDPK